MQTKGNSSDGFRVSISSAPSTSSHGSAQDDFDFAGDVYVWGEVISNTSARTVVDYLLPKPLESNLVLDAHHVDGGVRHASLVTKHGEVFTWGEESGGRLGHGMREGSIHPRLVESLAACNIVFVACGEYHTCALTNTGELYTWGDGAYNVGLLGHGTNVSHWIPKRVSGPLEDLQIAYISCGTWHTALITSNGQLFTFGDGTFGVLGHGDRESVSSPREVESVMGLKTIAVACGVWHTAAVVEVMVTQSSSSFCSGKLFTWGDGDKYRLGHGDKESKLEPTCVASLIEYDFYKVACGHSLTLGLTTSGQVFSMGSSAFGQLGNPRSDGRHPCSVEDKLAGEPVSQIACGSYHAAVLTTRSEVFTWGKGANGRLGHGDMEDRRTPTLVGALKDRSVRLIACGANFTAAICHHKWVSGAEQSQCASCRQPFGFARKRHNCHNCGLVHCNSCTSHKALRASLAPNPGKPYRVCDSCFLKLTSSSDSSGSSKWRDIIPRLSGESTTELKSKATLPTNMDMIRSLDNKAARQGRRTDALSFLRTPQVSSLLQLGDFALSSGNASNRAPKVVRTSEVRSLNPSRAVSPFSRRHSPPRATTPVPVSNGPSFLKTASDSLQKTNELLSQENERLRAQINNLRRRCEIHELELQKSAKKVHEALSMASEESAKSKAAKEVIKSLTAQLKDLAERLPEGQGIYEGVEANHLTNGIDSHHAIFGGINGNYQLRTDPIVSTGVHSPTTAHPLHTNGTSSQHHILSDGGDGSEMSAHSHKISSPRDKELLNRRIHSIEDFATKSSRGLDNSNRETVSIQNGEDGHKSRGTASFLGNQVEAEWVEQYEPGVYITLSTLRDGTRDLKRVRFSRRRFGEHQAEQWWSENREKVYEKYNVRGTERVSSAASTRSAR